MTLQTGRNRQGWRRVVTNGLAVSAVVAGAIAGVGAPTALADPADPTPTQPEISPEMSADDALAIIARDYDMGAGGGQLSNLIHQALQLRAWASSLEREQASHRESPGTTTEPGPAYRGIEGDDRLPAQAAGSDAEREAGQQPGYNFGVGQPPPGMGPMRHRARRSIPGVHGVRATVDRPVG